MTLKIYEGDHTFFAKHFGHHYQNQQVFLWAKWAWHHGASLVLYTLVPIVIIQRLLRERVADFGWQLGDWKFGLKATALTVVIMPLVVYNSSLQEAHRLFYTTEFPLVLATSSGIMFSAWAFTHLPHYIGWEFFFRGFIGMGFKKSFGIATALFAQTAFTTLMHIGKPEGETWGAAIGGIYLGLLTYRTNSVLYAILFHWYIGLLNIYFCSL